MTFQLLANCADLPNPDIFFSARKRDKALALATCASCVVRDECLQFALDNGDEFGIFGGMTAEQRGALV
jgi:WhiB family redox-sensing transcriptional regulator